MGGMLSAFYAITCCSKREATAFTPRRKEPSILVVVCRYMNNVYIAIAHVTNYQLTLATKVIHDITAVGAGYPPPLVLNLEPKGPQRFLVMCIRHVGTAIVISFFNKAADNRIWIKKGSTVQVRLPSASSMAMVLGTTQQARIHICGMLECGLQQVDLEMARAITELQYEAALSGYQHPHGMASPWPAHGLPIAPLWPTYGLELPNCL